MDASISAATLTQSLRGAEPPLVIAFYAWRKQK
jgi:hypothetical protein